MATSLITKKGRIIIPKEIRSHLKLYPGEKVEFLIKDEQVLLKSLATDVRELKGILPKPAKIVPISSS